MADAAPGTRAKTLPTRKIRQLNCIISPRGLSEMFEINDVPPQIDKALQALFARCRGRLRAGDVLVIHRPGDTHNSRWGGGTTLAAKLAGAVGVVMDGRSTGSSRFREFDLPGWIRGYSPITCHPLGVGGAAVCRPRKNWGRFVGASDCISSPPFRSRSRIADRRRRA